MIPAFDRLVAKCEWEGDCLVWQGTGAREYGTFQSGTNQADPKSYVHRWLYENTVGPIPDGYEIDHVAARGCHSKRCINPDHLEPVTHAENRKRSRLTVCRAGLHDLTDPANINYDYKGGRRGCKRCQLDGAKRRYHQKKEAVR